MRFADVAGHQVLASTWRNAVSSGRVAHAQLLDGPEGSGTLALARAYAQYLTCEQPSADDSCGVCKSCLTHRQLQHPDVHWCFPSFKADGADKATTEPHQKTWREALLASPSLGLEDWLEALGADRKQLFISVDEALEVNRKLGLKSFYGGWKVWICWLPETMRTDTANKFLKLMEEPSDRTVMLFITENSDRLLATIRSRVQRIPVPALSDAEVTQVLQSKLAMGMEEASQVAHVAEGNLAKAWRLAKSGNEQSDLQGFMDWMRACWARDGQAIVAGSEQFGSLGREGQKRFLQYALHVMRQAMVMHVGTPELARLTRGESGFLDKFKAFIHHCNILELRACLEKAHADVAGNVNGKLVFVQMSLQIHKLLRLPAGED